ncbi:hypothetical protein EC973_004095 [Apophysomyces ossiformis]|uniref:ubiquitinyl hydrolase 1 n=1 Tax=Apophysomyces ossiformis TaxID=679940 RepID=A0A8H7EMP9_9FUNG|nr:hypothetical protein EC973_004095 [Apophysomyces ossiformis]
MDLVPDIFFEKQEGNLCAQHAINALLQAHYFTAPDLAEIGRQLDHQERLIAGQASGKNYDDTGYFSIQVIQHALAIWNLELLPRQSTEAIQARESPETLSNKASYSVFVVRGSLPKSVADRRVLQLPMPGASEQKEQTTAAFSGRGYSLTGNNEEASDKHGEEEDEEIQLAKAIEASLQDSQPNDMEEMRRKRLARFGG